MQDKQVKVKETDITPFIVATFVVMVAVLIAKVAGDFTKKSTSVATRATKNATAADYRPFCLGKIESNLGKKYNTAAVQATVFAKLYTTDCGSLNNRFAAGVLSAGSGANQTVEPGVCCVALSQLYVVNDNMCTLKMPSGHWPDGKTVEHIPAVCKDKSDCTGSYGTINTSSYTVTTSYKCDNVTTTSVKSDKNYCCMMPLPTNTP